MCIITVCAISVSMTTLNMPMGTGQSGLPRSRAALRRNISKASSSIVPEVRIQPQVLLIACLAGLFMIPSRLGAITVLGADGRRIMSHLMMQHRSRLLQSTAGTTSAAATAAHICTAMAPAGNGREAAERQQTAPVGLQCMTRPLGAMRLTGTVPANMRP